MAFPTRPTAQVEVRRVPDVRPYPGSTEFCSEHIVGAPRRGARVGPSIHWTAHHSPDAPERVVAHYMKALGVDNHRQEGGGDVWRFPLDAPERVLQVTHPGGALPRGQCRPVPESARAIVVISTMVRP